MNKKEHIAYWVKSSEDDEDVFELLFANKHYVYAFFIAHLSIEKLLKALWVQHNTKDIPPKVHNLIHLLDKSGVELSKKNLNFLTQLNDFQIQGRYPDYKFKLHKLLNEKLAGELLEEYKEVRKCLKDLII